LDFFGVLPVGPRGATEEGGQLVFLLSVLGEFLVVTPLCKWGDLWAGGEVFGPIQCWWAC
jgi:hypothetical protein